MICKARLMDGSTNMPTAFCSDAVLRYAPLEVFDSALRENLELGAVRRLRYGRLLQLRVVPGNSGLRTRMDGQMQTVLAELTGHSHA